MNKNEYIARLAKGMEKYDVPNKYDILADYEQIVDEILFDNDDDFNAVIDKLGYPEILAMDIMEELGYESQRSERNKKQQTNTTDNTNRYGVKRQKSNAIWNFILFFYYIVQVGLTLALVVIAGLIIYLGFNSSASFDTKIANNNVETTIKICSNGECNSYVSSYIDSDSHFEKSEFSIKKCEDQKCQLIDSFDHSMSFPIGFVLALTGCLLLVMIWLLHVIIYKNVRAVTKKNDEYNRRRNYE